MDASKFIDRNIASLKDWRGPTLAAIRRIVHAADPQVTEEWKWMGTPTWSHEGILCIANAHKSVVKMTFAQGASLPDPQKVFNNGLGGNRWRAIDFTEGYTVNEPALKNIIRAALAFNLSKSKDGKTKSPNSKTAKAAPKKTKNKTLLRRSR